jgi:hypothetical protein
MRLNRAAAAIAAVAIVSGCGVTHHGAVTVTRPTVHLASSHPASSHLVAVRQSSSVDPATLWLESAAARLRRRPMLTSIPWPRIFK